MATPKPRSVFWVVTTIVSNTIAYTVLVMVICGCLLGMLSALFLFAIVAPPLSCAAATLHTLHFIRTRAIISQPRACFVPTVATFAAATAGLLIVVFQLGVQLHLRGGPVVPFNLTYIGVFGCMWLGANAVFAVMVYRFFQKLTAEHARGFDIQPVQRVEPLDQKPPAG